MKKILKDLFLFLLFLILLSYSVYAQTESEYNKTYINTTSEERISKISDSNYGNGNLERSFALQATATDITDDDAVLGDPNAPVTFVQFGSPKTASSSVISVAV